MSNIGDILSLKEFRKKSRRDLKIYLARSKENFSRVTEQYLLLRAELNEIKQILLTTNKKLGRLK